MIRGIVNHTSGIMTKLLKDPRADPNIMGPRTRESVEIVAGVMRQTLEAKIEGIEDLVDPQLHDLRGRIQEELKTKITKPMLTQKQNMRTGMEDQLTDIARRSRWAARGIEISLRRTKVQGVKKTILRRRIRSVGQKWQLPTGMDEAFLNVYANYTDYHAVVVGGDSK